MENNEDINMEQEPVIEPTEEESSYTPKEGSLIDINIVLNTLNTSKAEAVTDVINGYLECVIIDCDKPIRLELSLEEYPEIILYSTSGDSIVGTRYLNLRTNTISKDNEKFNFTDSKWALNNKIRCKVEGNINTMVNIILRYC